MAYAGDPPAGLFFAHVVRILHLHVEGASVATVQVGRTGMETLKNIPVNIKEFKPDLILSVPALAKNKKNIEQGIRRGQRRRLLFNHNSLSHGSVISITGMPTRRKEKVSRILLKPLVRLFDKLLFADPAKNTEVTKLYQERLPQI